MIGSMDGSGTPWQQVVSRAVHDMRTPLSAMKTTLEVMRLTQGDPEKSAKLISMMERQATELAELMERLAKDPDSYRAPLG